MTCSNKNILLNGGFRQGLRPWEGKNIKRVQNPVVSGDASLLLGSSSSEPSVLKQRIQTDHLESSCAYYLYFRLLNASPNQYRPTIFATVVYFDSHGKWLRATPLMITLPQPKALRFSPYFTIVPSPPKGTRSISVVFSLNKGKVFVDYIRLASHKV
ncbi:hypothetical protein [Thermoflavimicrobium dichotomicum]|uniref:Carbohydrate binding domain-containing protein n=1 Tax=Thermoflavimicrobium dichotomicum TaxID=46223 RepID=A0A1I3QEP0_9BACL|nr:hypothetical protein [Thermoflavimicrobium dichotomicum]SFJ31999.1 hypothetical protein SAMN05421852_107121 [Thermoflavimicrobium dichotomicum]